MGDRNEGRRDKIPADMRARGRIMRGVDVLADGSEIGGSSAMGEPLRTASRCGEDGGRCRSGGGLRSTSVTIGVGVRVRVVMVVVIMVTMRVLVVRVIVSGVVDRGASALELLLFEVERLLHALDLTFEVSVGLEHLVASGLLLENLLLERSYLSAGGGKVEFMLLLDPID